MIGKLGERKKENFKFLRKGLELICVCSIHTCCPRQIRGPALKGQNMKGFGVRYLRNLSSRKRSGSNTSARKRVKESTDYDVSEENCGHTIRTPQICSTMHDENAVDASETISIGILDQKRK